jgi:hypothetical protein
MANYGSDDFGFFTIGPYNLTTAATKITETHGREAVVSTPYGVSAPEYLPGIMRTFELTASDGWYDDADNKINEAFVNLTAGENVMILAEHGNSAPATGVGLVCTATDGVQKTKYTRELNVGDYTKANFEIVVSGTVDSNAKLCAPLTARGVTGTTAATYLNWGADGAAGGRAYLVVTSVTWGTRTSLDIVLQDCNTSDGAYGDHTAFTQIVPATTPEGQGTSEMKALAAAAIEQYTCVTWTWAGGGAGTESATFAVVVVYD